MPSIVGFHQQQQEQEDKESLYRLIHKERKRSVQLHLLLLSHAARCQNSKCPSPNCARMKKLLLHQEQGCKKQGSCRGCKRLGVLLRMHARQCCQGSSCHVPRCRQVRERTRQMQEEAAKAKTIQEKKASIGKENATPIILCDTTVCRVAA